VQRNKATKVLDKKITQVPTVVGIHVAFGICGANWPQFWR